MHERLAVVLDLVRRRQSHPTMNSAEITAANNGENIISSVFSQS